MKTIKGTIAAQLAWGGFHVLDELFAVVRRDTQCSSQAFFDAVYELNREFRIGIVSANDRLEAFQRLAGKPVCNIFN